MESQLPQTAEQKAVQPEGRRYSTLGIVFAVLSLVVLPIAFGPVGIVFGVIGVVKGDTKRGVIAIVLSVVFATISTLVAAYLISPR